MRYKNLKSKFEISMCLRFDASRQYTNCQLQRHRRPELRQKIRASSCEHPIRI
jgi:hypothetical protein